MQIRECSIIVTGHRQEDFWGSHLLHLFHFQLLPQSFLPESFADTHHVSATIRGNMSMQGAEMCQFFRQGLPPGNAATILTICTIRSNNHRERRKRIKGRIKHCPVVKRGTKAFLTHLYDGSNISQQISWLFKGKQVWKE